MGKKALILLAEGFEEIEAITPADYLRRAGIEVFLVSLAGTDFVSGSHGIKIKQDTTLEKLLNENKLDPSFWDAVVLPGGLPGAENLASSKETGEFLLKMVHSGKWVCAICASPALVLAPLNLLKGKRFTCYPGLEEKVKDAEWSQEITVTEKNPNGGGIITSRAAGTSGHFAVAIINSLLSEIEGKTLFQKVLLQ